jgi:hypothetical protein
MFHKGKLKVYMKVERSIFFNCNVVHLSALVVHLSVGCIFTRIRSHALRIDITLLTS